MKITEDVYQLDCTRQSHVFLIRDEENILIDSGMPGRAKKILSELDSVGVNPKSIRHILLTHHDIDHVGNAKVLQVATEADLWAPIEDIPYIVGQKNRPGIKRVIQMAARPLKPQFIQHYQNEQVGKNIRIIATPGHTPGHIMIQYKNILFIGDLFKVIDGTPTLLPNFMNWNTERVKESISIIKGLEFDWICPSHGEPIHNGNIVKEFLMKF